MRVNNWLASATEKLETADVPSARLDCLILLEDTLHKDRAYLLAHPETKLDPHQLGRLNRQVKRRASHEPLAYIRGFTEFYGRRFRVNKHVLEPRPESETMIELLKKLDLPNKPKIADVGTGCGAIGITAALELHDPHVDLYDIDSSALAVAKHNSILHELHLQTHKRDLLNRPARDYEVVLANLPYIPTTWKINEAAHHEPRHAIFGGKDGLDLYRRLFEQISKMPNKPHFVLTESLPPQHQKLTKITEKANYHQLAEEDFIQVFIGTE